LRTLLPLGLLSPCISGEVPPLVPDTHRFRMGIEHRLMSWLLLLRGCLDKHRLALSAACRHPGCPAKPLEHFSAGLLLDYPIFPGRKVGQFLLLNEDLLLMREAEVILRVGELPTEASLVEFSQRGILQQITVPRPLKTYGQISRHGKLLFLRHFFVECVGTPKPLAMGTRKLHWDLAHAHACTV